MTLACKDGQQVEAHKVILAFSIPFFQKWLTRNKHNHPLVYMRGMKSENLLAIVDFLQLKGLIGKTDAPPVRPQTPVMNMFSLLKRNTWPGAHRGRTGGARGAHGGRDKLSSSSALGG